MKLQKLQSSIEQQARVRNEVQQLEQYIEPKKSDRHDQFSQINERKYDLDSTNERLLESVNEIDEEVDEVNERHHLRSHDHAHNSPWNKLKEYREEDEDE